MKNKFTLFYMLLLLVLLTGSNSSCYSQSVNPTICSIFGSVYYENDPSKADFKIFVETSEAFADLIVFHQNNRLFADKAGLWFVTEKRDLADFRVYLAEDKRKADFSIFYTTTESFAGCPK